jgi:hypothetical protein
LHNKWPDYDSIVSLCSMGLCHLRYRDGFLMPVDRTVCSKALLRLTVLTVLSNAMELPVFSELQFSCVWNWDNSSRLGYCKNKMRYCNSY